MDAFVSKSNSLRRSKSTVTPADTFGEFMWVLDVGNRIEITSDYLEMIICIFKRVNQRHSYVIIEY